MSHDLVVLSTFTVEPDRQAELTQVLTDNTDAVLRHRPGFLGSTIEASIDGTRVVNHACWRSADDLTAMMTDPACRRHLVQVAAIATVDAVRYRVASTHAPSSLVIGA